MTNLRQSLLGWLASAFLLVGCQPTAAVEPEQSWPKGTAIVVGDVVVSRVDIEDTADALALVNPVHTRPALRREALLAQLLPRAAVRSVVGERVDEVLSEAKTALEILRGNTEGTPPEIFLATGYPTAIGFNRWSRARTLDLNHWSGPYEGVGNWFMLRVLERSFEEGETRPELEYFEVEWVSFDFLPAKWDSARSEATLSRVGVRAVQPEYIDLIPYQHRLDDQK